MNLKISMHCGRISSYSALLAALLLVLSHSAPASGQKKSTTVDAVQGCDPYLAFALVQKSVDEVKVANHSSSSIYALIRAADLIWPFQENSARRIFTDAVEAAQNDFRRSADLMDREESPGGKLPDQRFVVLRAIARRDPEWATRLATKMAEADQTEGRKATDGDGQGDRLIDLAASLVPINQAAAVSLAHASFSYPAGFRLPAFFYQLATVNRSAADQLFREALVAYGETGPDNYIYLSPYPFGLGGVIGPVRRGSMSYKVPGGYAASGQLQQLFIESFLGMAEGRLRNAPVAEADLSDAEQLYAGLNSLESLIAARNRQYMSRLLRVRAAAQDALSLSARDRANSFETPGKNVSSGNDQISFSESLAQVLNITNEEERDRSVANLVLKSVNKETLNLLVDAAQRIDEVNLKDQILNWIYVSASQKALKAGLLSESLQFAEKVEPADLRALLLTAISLDRSKRHDRAGAIEALERAASLASKAPDTNAKAKALLGTASLFASLDEFRAFVLIDEAIKTANALDLRDLESPSVQIRVEGKNFNIFLNIPAPDFTLDRALVELSARNFEGAVDLARKLTDIPLRATATMALAQRCLEVPPREVKRPSDRRF